jgi:hypothetical protein
MFFCSIPAAAIVTTMAMVFSFKIEGALGVKPVGDAWHVLAFVLSPGWYVGEFLIPQKAGFEGLDFLFYGIVANFVYYFCLVFVFSLWADRRWRRKRAARIEA